MIQRNANGKYLVKSEKTGKLMSRPMSKPDAALRRAADMFVRLHKKAGK